MPARPDSDLRVPTLHSSRSRSTDHSSRRQRRDQRVVAARNRGGAIGLAAGGASPAAALTGGSQLALELAAGFVVLAIVVAITVIPSGSATRSEKRADEEAPEFDAIADAA